MCGRHWILVLVFICEGSGSALQTKFQAVANLFNKPLENMGYVAQIDPEDLVKHQQTAYEYLVVNIDESNTEEGLWQAMLLAESHYILLQTIFAPEVLADIVQPAKEAISQFVMPSGIQFGALNLED